MAPNLKSYRVTPVHPLEKALGWDEKGWLLSPRAPLEQALLSSVRRVILGFKSQALKPGENTTPRNVP